MAPTPNKERGGRDTALIHHTEINWANSSTLSSTPKTMGARQGNVQTCHLNMFSCDEVMLINPWALNKFWLLSLKNNGAALNVIIQEVKQGPWAVELKSFIRGLNIRVRHINSMVEGKQKKHIPLIKQYFKKHFACLLLNKCSLCSCSGVTVAYYVGLRGKRESSSYSHKHKHNTVTVP